MQAAIAASVSGNAGTEEVTEESAPVDIRTNPPQLTRRGRLQPPASHIHSERAVTTARVTHCIHVVASLLVRYLKLHPKRQSLYATFARKRARPSLSITVAKRAPPKQPRFPKCSRIGRALPSKTSRTPRRLLSGNLVREPGIPCCRTCKCQLLNNISIRRLLARKANTCQSPCGKSKGTTQTTSLRIARASMTRNWRK